MFQEREEACGVKEVVGLKAREGQTDRCFIKALFSGRCASGLAY